MAPALAGAGNLVHVRHWAVSSSRLLHIRHLAQQMAILVSAATCFNIDVYIFCSRMIADSVLEYPTILFHDSSFYHARGNYSKDGLLECWFSAEHERSALWPSTPIRRSHMVG